MYKITALKQQKRNKQRVSVFLDDEFAFGLPLAAALDLRVGQMLSDGDIEVLQSQAAVEAAKQSALRFISYRPRSVSEVRRNLQKKDYEEPTIDAALDALQQARLLDDDAFARYWVEQRETFKPRSPFALAQELRQKGVDRAVIDSVLQDVDSVASARRAAEKKAPRWRQLAEEDFRVKLGGYLQRRGFRYEVIRTVTDELIQEYYASDH